KRPASRAVRRNQSSRKQHRPETAPPRAERSVMLRPAPGAVEILGLAPARSLAVRTRLVGVDALGDRQAVAQRRNPHADGMDFNFGELVLELSHLLGNLADGHLALAAS